MKIKRVIAAMSILGFISVPGFAQNNNSTVPPVPADYKGEAICVPTPSALVMNSMTQNVGRSLPDPCSPDWYKRISISGGVNVDMGKWGSRSANFDGENYRRVALNDVYLNIAASVTTWASVFASLSYNNTSAIYSASSLYPINRINLEQAYATIGDFTVSPLFLQVGKQFQDFSRYEIHPITRSLTQVLSETLATSVKAGFITPVGFNGSIAVFDNPVNAFGTTSTATDYILALGFDRPSDQFGFDLGAAYQYNMTGVNDIARYIPSTGFNNRVGGVAVYGDINSGPFSLGARYTTAVNTFSASNLPANASLTSGARPWAAGVEAGYDFMMWSKNQNLYVGYQASGEASAVNLPKQRWLVGYNVDVVNNINLGGEWDHDIGYGASENAGTATTGNTNLFSLRAAVKFG